MNTEDLGNSKILNLVFKPAGFLMGSKLRKWFMNPEKKLHLANVQLSQNIYPDSLKWWIGRSKKPI